MKKLKTIVIALFLMFVLSSCGGPTGPQTTDVVITKTLSFIELKDTDVLKYDYKTLFKIKENDSNVEVLDEYIDKSNLKEEVGEYIVSCTYKEKSESITVKVYTTEYVIELTTDEISVKKSSVKDFDFVSLFNVLVDGMMLPITPDMIETNVIEEVGTYYFKVSIGDISKTLTVHVTDDHTYLVVPSYKEFELEISKAKSFDYTMLFTLYVDGASQRVETQMLKLPLDSELEVGKTYDVLFSYEIGGEVLSSKVSVKIVNDPEIIINAKTIETYPNAGYIDLTSLFEVTYGKEIIKVTPDMITGEVDYTKEGTYQITVNYMGVTKVATVTIKLGVIIDYATSDKIIIRKGTDITTYDFLKDFKVIINGILFTNISEEYLDLSTVNFDEVGTYTVKLVIPYNDSRLGLSQVNFKYIEKSLTYEVIENNYTINVINDNVILPIDTTKYNVFNNVDVYINNRNQTLTRYKENVDLITCYVEEVSAPIDFTKTGKQEVVLAIYVNGPEKDPVEVRFTVMIASYIEITALPKIVVEGATLYTKDLFKITENEKEVDVTYDMISGKVDTFTPGKYVISITYKDVTKDTTVYVLNKNIIGTYFTTLKTIAEEDLDEDETTKVEPVRLSNVIIRNDLTIKINKKDATLIDAIDENTLIVTIASTVYTLYFVDGILIINPNNDVKLTFSNDKRPLIYFKQDMYTVKNHIVINSGSSYVLSGTVTVYSIDAFNLVNTSTNQSMWYGLMVDLVDKTSVDTIYSVTWGEITASDEIDLTKNAVNTIEFNDSIYQFTLMADNVGKITKSQQEKKYAGMVFDGEIDGNLAKLIVSQYEGFTLQVDGKTILSLNSNEVSSLSNGGIDYKNDIVFLYSPIEGISYKLSLDLESLTFTCFSKDDFFGKYEYENIYIFIDGYGTGIVNFNTKSYYLTQFKYRTNDKNIEIEYINTKPSFEYEAISYFVMDDFRNVITSKSFMNDKMNEKEFENSKIIDGAIVKINYYKVGADADSVAKVKMFNNIEIITKNGSMSYDEKLKCIDTSKVKFGKAGFYQFTITLTVLGKQVTHYYAIEVQKPIYEGNIIASEYGAGVIFSDNTLSIDKYGNAIVSIGGTVFRGIAKIDSDNTFVIKAKGDTLGSITLKGELLIDGVILVRCSGSASFSDYFTLGQVRSTGSEKIVLREFTYASNTIYILSTSLTSTGNMVDLEYLTDSIIKIDSSNIEYIIKILTWGNTKTGIVHSDEYRGTYKKEGYSDIVVDGFGTVKYNDTIATYVMNSNALIMTSGKNVKVFKLNKTQMTYEEVNIALDNTLVENKTFTGVYTFVCSGYYYSAETSFAFKENGRVLITSTSQEHDSGEDSCLEDIYDPSFASKKGTWGTYTVNGNEVTITVNDITIVFAITNIITVDRITAVSSTIERGSHGWFAAETIFDIE